MLCLFNLSSANGSQVKPLSHDTCADSGQFVLNPVFNARFRGKWLISCRAGTYYVDCQQSWIQLTGLSGKSLLFCMNFAASMRLGPHWDGDKPLVKQMIEFFSNILSQNGFMPHGMCFQWQPAILWMHVIADLVVAIAYFSIPAALVFVLARRRHIPFKWLIVLFASFILLCGMTHVISMLVLWEPVYRLQAVVKMATALVSIATAVVLFPMLPKLMVAAENFEQTMNEK